MSYPALEIISGALEGRFQRELQAFQRELILERVWAKDVNLWSDTDLNRTDIQGNLKWLDLPETLSPHLEQMGKAANSAMAEGLTDWVLLSLGSANLAAQALMPLITLRPGLRFFILDGVEPARIARVAREINLERAFFMLVSRSGDMLEGNALYHYFREKVRLSEIAHPMQHFASATQADSYLASLGRSYVFRTSLYDPPGIPAPYGSTLHFGALLMGLCGMAPEPVLEGARQLRAACLPAANAAQNPTLPLAALLSAAMEAGRRFLVFLAQPSLAMFTVRLGYLIGGSLSKGEFGLIPIAGRTSRYTEPFEGQSLFVILENQAQLDGELQGKCESFAANGVPFVRVRISNPTDLLTEAYRWELTSVLTAGRLKIDPFDYPDARPARRRAMEMLDKLATSSDVLSRTPRLQERGIALFAESRTRQQISTLNLLESLRSFFRLRQPDRVQLILLFLEKTPEVESRFLRVRDLLTRTLGQPVIVVFGPRSMDHYADLFRTELRLGLCIVVTAESAVDIPVPGTHYSFGQLKQALALGEFGSLALSGPLVIRLHLASASTEALAEFEGTLEQALRR